MPEPQYIDLGTHVIDGVTVRRKVATGKTEEEKKEIMRTVFSACAKERRKKEEMKKAAT